ncbi:uncharacterized protein LOC115627980 [Scaptodrosophila lebanonensis]|uniref:Uncharacterized protein LOC115627980 n=1 Tax=Drosophila lebanonensis TaxID=7225 RepID=A0A6J2TT26_DROLE|nr:uncharacterized protein LOC115627980 [Scaptodrosophila lebanonensis]
MDADESHSEAQRRRSTPVDANGETNEREQPLQITSIDGFFNRKRGRPPKNRFVEVYKSTQQSPQAIFTSFKLEKNESAAIAAAAAAPLSHNAGVVTTMERSSLLGTSHELPHSRRLSRKRGPTIDQTTVSAAGRQHQRSQRQPTLGVLPSSPAAGAGCERKRRPMDLLSEQDSALQHSTETLVMVPEDSEAVAPAMMHASSEVYERVSVVRAAGTFYPENLSPAAESVASSPEQPEDLSMKNIVPSKRESVADTQAIPTTTSGLCSEPAENLKLLQFKHLLNLYQRQVLLPGFLRTLLPLPMPPIAADSSVPLDMRLLLESAVQQKQLLLNVAAVAATATAAASSAASPSVAATSQEQPPPIIVAPLGDTPPRKQLRGNDIPTGYLKFRFNEDCHFERCGYRNHQSHFHCNRKDCHYSFCDRTRFMQHTARHERLDTLMGSDFLQFRANMQCGVPNCCFAMPMDNVHGLDAGTAAAGTQPPKKSSHFHCRKCDYVCCDSSKVVAHRRLHSRMEYLRSAGFRKIARYENCENQACSYALRHTHYHCLSCDCSVLSRAQLASHKHRSGGVSNPASGSALVSAVDGLPKQLTLGSGLDLDA